MVARDAGSLGGVSTITLDHCTLTWDLLWIVAIQASATTSPENLVFPRRSAISLADYVAPAFDQVATSM